MSYDDDILPQLRDDTFVAEMEAYFRRKEDEARQGSIIASVMSKTFRFMGCIRTVNRPMACAEVDSTFIRQKVDAMTAANTRILSLCEDPATSYVLGPLVASFTGEIACWIWPAGVDGGRIGDGTGLWLQ